MGLLDSATLPTDRSSDAADKASRALESLALRQLLAASGVFHGSETAGSGLRADLFAEALADAVANAGGIGLGAQLATAAQGTPVPRGPDVASIAALVDGGRVSSGFGARADPIDGHASRHTGVDVAAAEGTPIHAAAGGIVRQVGARGGYGNAVEIDHGNGVTTLYGHASELLVHEGEEVAKGQAIALVGYTGRSTGPHLHFEVRLGDRPADPVRAVKTYNDMCR